MMVFTKIDGFVPWIISNMKSSADTLNDTSDSTTTNTSPISTTMTDIDDENFTLTTLTADTTKSDINE